MRRSVLVWSVVLWWCAAPACALEQSSEVVPALSVQSSVHSAQLAPILSQPAIVVLGDSHSLSHQWPAILQQALRASGWSGQWLVLAEGGLTPLQMYQRLTMPVDDASAHAWAGSMPESGQVLVLLGTNGYMLEPYRELLQWLQQRQYIITVLSCPPRIASVKKSYSTAHANFQFNQQLRALTNAMPTVQFIDIVPALRDPALPADRADYLSPALSRDHVHLNAAGNQALVDALLPRLLRPIGQQHEPAQ